jgi:nicotinamidase-related amidase
MPHTALFVVDIQAGLADDSKTQITHAERIRHVGQAILSKARAITKKALTNGTDIGLRIVFVQHHETGEEEGSLLKGSKAWELVFKPQDEMEYVVEKIDSGSMISSRT